MGSSWGYLMVAMNSQVGPFSIVPLDPSLGFTLVCVVAAIFAVASGDVIEHVLVGFMVALAIAATYSVAVLSVPALIPTNPIWWDIALWSAARQTLPTLMYTSLVGAVGLFVGLYVNARILSGR